ncbi:PKD domain-containing protein [Ningiella sp. W23]|uniref:PKD domain-containing protein n=1 Tax=Ningiella sp. W23 TaxID=3023715 RepID=UPI00375649BA
MKWNNITRTLLLSVFLVFMTPSAFALVCDADEDNDVDKNDIGLIFQARGQSALGPDDPRDEDGDGVITIFDGRACSAQCNLARCAIVTPSGNTPPVADAGMDDSALVGESVTLNGANSSDADGDAITYSWSFIQRPSGSGATLSDPSSVNPSFTLDVSGNYEIQLVVNDATVDSAPDSVIISTENSAPVADAGADQSPLVNDIVMLDGSASSDVNGDTLTFSWRFVSQPDASSAVLLDEDSVSPSFLVDAAGTYEVSLIVNDGSVDSAPDIVLITTQNSAPVANAGDDISANVGDTLSLDGTASSDVDGDSLSYSWSILSAPVGSTAVLSDPVSSMPSITIDLSGNYQVQLIVNDGDIDSLADVVSISTTNTAPIADAGADLTPFIGDTVTLNGSASSDADGDPLSYAWSLTTRPFGSAASLSDPSSAMPSFDVDVSGSYIAQLIVNDGSVDSLPDTVSINTLNSPPVANAGMDQDVNVGDTAVLNASASSDPDGDPLSFVWSITSQPAGSATSLSDVNAQMPSIGIDVAGEYVIQLIVNDGTTDSAPDSVILSTTNTRPVADAGPDRTAEVGDTVALDASASFDADGDTLNYAWSITSRPPSSTASLSSVDTVTSDFIADVAGTYVVQVSVDDGALSALDTVVIQTENQPPVADAGNNQSVTVGDNVILNGSGSSDPDGDAITYSWTIASAPATSVAALSNADSVAPSFTADAEGDYIIELIVNDGEEDSSTDSITVTAEPADIELSITISSNLIGVGRTSDVEVSLSSAAPSGGLEISLASSDLGVADVNPGSFVVPEGEFIASFTVSGIALGSATLTASAPGLANAAVAVTVSSDLISLGELSEIAPGEMTDLALSISSPAPSGGVVISLISSDESVATVSSSVTIAEGALVPSANPVVSGVALGSATITATATGYAPDSAAAEVVASLSFEPNPVNIAQGESSDVTIRLSAPAPAGGVIVDLSSSDTAIFTVPASVTVAQGQLTAVVSLSGIDQGSAQLLASATGIPETSLPVTVSSGPAINLTASASIGRNLQALLSGSLESPAPAGNLDITITSNNPSLVLLAQNPTDAGSTSITVTANAGSSSVPVFYVQGLASSGSATITATADSYTASTSTITLVQSGAIINSPSSISTTPFSSNSTVSLRLYRLQADGTLSTIQALRGGISVSVPITSSDTSVGVLTATTADFTGGESLASVEFDPISVGTTDIAVGSVSELDTATVFQSIEATVNGAQILFSDTSVGQNLQRGQGISLGVAPPGPVEVTVTSSDPSVLVVSNASETTGSASTTFTNVTTAFGGTVFIQGVSKGSATITVSADGYSSANATVTVQNSGFIISSPSTITTDVFAVNRTITLTSYMLNASNAIAQRQELRAGQSASVGFSLDDTSVGEIIPLTADFVGGDVSVSVEFDPQNAGSATLSLTTPSGFDTPANFQSIPIVVTAPTITPGISSTTEIGQNLQRTASVSFSSAPPSAQDLIISSSNPSVVVLSTDPTVAGSSSITLNSASTFVGSYVLQGLSKGTSDISFTSTNYTPITVTVTVSDSGFIIASPSSINTTVFSPDTNVRLSAYLLNSTTLAIVQQQALRAGFSVDVPLVVDDPTVGVITTSPVTFSGNDVTLSTGFSPIASGTTTVAVTQPTGFSTPSRFTSIDANVSAPSILISDVTVGKDLQQGLGITLDAAPPSPVDVTVSVSAGAIAVISDNITTAGTNTITFSNVTSTFVGTLFVQGIDIGTTQLTASAPGYTSDISNVSVEPAGFIISTPSDFITTTTPRAIRVQSFRLNPTTLNIQAAQSVRAGLDVTVDLLNSDNSVGTLSDTSLDFIGGSASVQSTFTPIAPGTTNISVQTPPGFSTASNFSEITATVVP